MSITAAGSQFPSSTQTFSYNLQGRMSGIELRDLDSAGQQTRIQTLGYSYGPDGIRISTTEATDSDGNGVIDSRTRTDFLIDAHNFTGYQQVLQEITTNADTGAEINRVVYTLGLDQISQTTYANGSSAGTTLFFHSDGHGSTRILTDFTGAIATVAGAMQPFHFDAYGNPLGFNPALTATTFLYNNEERDLATGFYNFRARPYEPATARLLGLDPFAGNRKDPLSLHKYLYAHADPANFVDPSGLFSGLVGQLSVSTITSSMTAMNVGATVILLKKVYDVIETLIGDPELRRVAHQLRTRVRTKTDIKTEAKENPHFRYFVHGSSSGAWPYDAIQIDPTFGIRTSDFGLGFYTFEATVHGILTATKRAKESADKPRGGGVPFLLFVRITTTDYAQLLEKDYGTVSNPSHDYLPDVNAFRSGVLTPITGYDVVKGPVAKKAEVGQPWAWDVNPDYPEQYKFESWAAVLSLEVVGVAPLYFEYKA
jgi:RHS repeat-associated protein